MLGRSRSRIRHLVILCYFPIFMAPGFTISAANDVDTSEERERLIPYINEIFGTLDRVTEKDFGSEKIICRETVVLVLKAIKENKVSISIDRDLPVSFINGIGFRYSADKQNAALAFNPKVLE